MREIKVGNIIELAGFEWVILDTNEERTKLLSKDCVDKKYFDFKNKSNNWAYSEIREYLNGEFYNKLHGNGLDDNAVFVHKQDLTALDGTDDYKHTFDLVGLLTIDEYKKYRKIIPKTDEDWWLVTPHNNIMIEIKNEVILRVTENGAIDFGLVNVKHGVRPTIVVETQYLENNKYRGIKKMNKNINKDFEKQFIKRRVKVMSKYPLKIERVREFEGVSTTGYYSKGHHDKNEFIEAVKCDYEYEGNIDDVRHIYIKVSPSPTGSVLINYRNEPCRGSFPATVIDV